MVRHEWGLAPGRWCEPGPLSALFVSQLQRGPAVTDQVCACPNEQCADPLPGTKEPRGMIIESDSRPRSGSTLIEEILMSGLGEGS
jgi:hypothetical protein